MGGLPILLRQLGLLFLWLADSLAAPEAVTAKCDYTQIEIREECPNRSGLDWEAYGEALYRARSQTFLGDSDAALRGIHELLTVATTPFHRAFECPPAVASTYFSLAQILGFQGRLRRAAAIIQMGFVFIRDKGFSECTPWPMQGWDMLLAGRNVAHKVRELDAQAVDLRAPRHVRFEKSKMAVVTVCAYAEEEPVRLLSIGNHELYTQLHGYDLHMFTSPTQILPHAAGGMDVNDGKHKAFFWKVNAVRNVFDMDANYDWVLWADCDAFFMDPERTLDSIIHMYTSNTSSPTVPPRQMDGAPDWEEGAMLAAAIAQDRTPVELLVAVDSTGINNGVWLMRNSDWSKKFLDRWWHSDILQGAGENHNCSDQSTMQHQLLQDNAMRLDALWDSVEGPIWPPEVRVVAQEHLQSFHQATAMTVASREWVDGDFIRHHPGCHYYKEPCQQLYLQAATIFEDKVRALVQRQSLNQ
mmetsp:Transcript_171/g.385  ORF Transcript_171/g.385 Transcript_171/m.385 type:complete len:471 (-) Transcript_171:174-1586(-)